MLMLICGFQKWESILIFLLIVEIVWTIWACVSLLNWMKSKIR